MQQQPTADEVGGRPSRDDHQFAKQDYPYQADVLVLDAKVDDALREERHDELHTAQQKTKEYLEEILAVLHHVPPEEPERSFLPCPVIMPVVEVLGGL